MAWLEFFAFSTIARAEKRAESLDLSALATVFGGAQVALQQCLILRLNSLILPCRITWENVKELYRTFHLIKSGHFARDSVDFPFRA